MGKVNDWWLNRRVSADWTHRMACVQGFRPVGGYLIGTGSTLEFVPNRFEARIGAREWRVDVAEVTALTLKGRRLRIDLGTGHRHTLWTNFPGALRLHFGGLPGRAAWADLSH